VERKEETSWAVVGSKGWKVVVVAGSWRVSEEEEEAGESVGRRLPVRVSQMDMVRWVGWKREWGWVVRAATVLCWVDVVLGRREIPKIIALIFADPARPSASAPYKFCFDFFQFPDHPSEGIVILLKDLRVIVVTTFSPGCILLIEVPSGADSERTATQSLV